MAQPSSLLALISLLFIIVSLLGNLVFADDFTVYFEKGSYVVRQGYDLKSGIAAAHYDATYESRGWDVLSLETNGMVKDDMQAFGAGYLEGVITRQRIYNHYMNMQSYSWAEMPDKKMPGYVRDFFDKQRNWMKDQSTKYASDPFWQQIKSVYLQMEGLVQGYNDATTNPNEKIDYASMQTISSFGDIFDILNVKQENRPQFHKMTPQQIMTFVQENGHCSALFKVTPDYSNIYFGHTSWFTFSAMTRIYKTYTFNFNNRLVASPTVTFSSYPANLASNDDFYVTKSGLVVIETSNNIFNTSLYDLVKPESLLCWQRVILANRLASDAPEWSDIFSEYNSGTYNNQFMVLDTKKFTPGKSLNKNLFWVVEQIPGKVYAADQTEILSFGYWPSYNVPFYKEVFTISGYPEILKKPNASDMLSYETCVRANIFRRDQSTVNSIDSMKRMLRYNNYRVDPLSLGNPGYAIASRNDLRQQSTNLDRSCSGGYDTKVSSIADIQTIHIINGPTYDNVPAFQWAGQCPAKFAHQGMRDNFRYDWMTVNWRN
ncbi:hypothetical protein C9374_008874 [Naegleria lovaniensis]|uniref:Phospholipase B-like n=1 Tax=Naegleria lovaniensis TaxID=51637 RepID=A0AA88KKG6_NAELO|nr:uncharacterized protein C9374_008874 [Naegleria lovaniensis]KAG2377789.1 hypothetical protein C9374_008874 [Naegleria lovaniensis]